MQSQARYAGVLPCDHRQEVVARMSVHEPRIPHPPLRIRQIGIKLLFLNQEFKCYYFYQSHSGFGRFQTA